MKKPLIAALAGFVVAFAAGAASTPAEAAPTAGQSVRRCSSNAHCQGYNPDECGGYAICLQSYCVCA